MVVQAADFPLNPDNDFYQATSTCMSCGNRSKLSARIRLHYFRLVMVVVGGNHRLPTVIEHLCVRNLKPSECVISKAYSYIGT